MILKPSPFPTATSAALIVLALAALTACSPDASSSPAAGGGKATDITIVREQVYDDPKDYVAVIRDLIGKCDEARRAMGTQEAPGSARSISDDEILRLAFAHTEERFSGDRYAQDKRTSEIDYQSWGPAPGQSCIPKAISSRVLTIVPAKCKQINVSYDVNGGAGTREELADVCAPAERHDQVTGDLMQLSQAGQTCRWDAPAGQNLVRECLLEPLQYYPTSGKPLVVQSETDRKMMPAHPIADINRVMQALPANEKLVRLEVGTPILASFFEAPPDSKSFPTPEGSK